MRAFLRTTLLSTFALALAHQGNAQQKQIHPGSLKKAVAPQYAGTFSPRTGWVASSGNQSRMGDYAVVNNSVLSNYYSVPGKNQEWVDINMLHDRNTDHTEQVNGMVYTYCSSDLNPNGMHEVINIYDESVYCAGPVNWPVADCSYGISGLPGAVNGSLACWVVSVDLWGVECNLTSGGGQSMGWGQVWDNSTTGPWIAQGGHGQVDAFTWFDWDAPVANAFMGCYWFGGIPWIGFDMKMMGGPVDTNRYWAEDLGGYSTAFDNAGLDVDTSVKNGDVCTFTVTDPLGIGIDQMALIYSRSIASTPFLFNGGNVLVDPFNFHQIPIGDTSQTFTIPVGGIDLYSQAACFANGVHVGFTNGLHHQSL